MVIDVSTVAARGGIPGARNPEGGPPRDGRRRGWRLAAFLLLPVLAGACAGTPPAGTVLRVRATAPGTAERMRRILASPPDLAWEVSRLQPKGGYWHVPGDESGPGFFLSRTGFHYAESDTFALSYERTADGFTLAEVKKRAGEQPLAQCPVFFPVENCVERHALIIATLLSCRADTSCTYRFVVFDSYSPFQILNQAPSIPSLMKRLVDGWRGDPDIDVKFEESGVVFDTDQAWADFITDRFAFIAAEVRSAQRPDGFQLRNPLAW